MAILNRLVQRFQKKAYRRTYVDDFSNTYLATQIKVLREQRNLTQEKFAELVDAKQSQVCSWEDVNRSSWQLRTLRKIAAALDLVLVVRFESFGEALPHIENFSRASLERPSFAQDPAFKGVRVVASLEVVSGGREDASTAQSVFPAFDAGAVSDAEARFTTTSCEAQRCIA